MVISSSLNALLHPRISSHPSPLAWVATVSLLGSACGFGRDPEASRVEIAEIAGRPVYLADFAPVLARGLAGSGSVVSDEVKSRLLDQFLEEQVLLDEAQRQGVRVDDAEVDRALSGLAAADAPVDASYRDEVRSHLTVEKLLRRHVEATSSVTVEDEAAYYREHTTEFHRAAVVVLRQILLDSRASAEAARAEAAGSPGRFAEIAAGVSLSPDRGRPQSFAIDSLPDEVADAIVDLRPGELTEVIERPPDFLIFRLEGVKPARDLSLEEARPEIRARLIESGGTGALARLLADLKARRGVTLVPGNLPFQYVPERPA
jgi:parvulin-like peptidyl-prolyl isomerase